MTRRESIQHAVHFLLSGIMMCGIALGVMRYEENKRAAAGIASVAVPSLPPGGQACAGAGEAVGAEV